MAKPKLTMVRQVGTFFGKLESLLIAWNFLRGATLRLNMAKKRLFFNLGFLCAN